MEEAHIEVVLVWETKRKGIQNTAMNKRSKISAKFGIKTS